MALKDIVKISRRTYFDPRRWLGYDFVVSQTAYLWLFFKFVFGSARTTPKPKHTESFDVAMKRLNLTEKDLQETSKRYYISAIVFAVLATCMLVLFIWYLVQLSLAASLITLGVTALLYAQAFRFHFWHFQIKHRKLGCTFDEWYQGKVHTKGHPHA